MAGVKEIEIEKVLEGFLSRRIQKSLQKIKV